MITALRLERFRLFKTLDLPKLTRFTIIGGANNAGKTSVLESLAMLFGRLNPNMFAHQLNWRGIPNVQLAVDAVWAPVFHDYDLSRPFLIMPTCDGLEERLVVTFDPSPKGLAFSVSAPLATQGMLAPVIEATAAPAHAALLFEYFVAKECVQKSWVIMVGTNLQTRVETNTRPPRQGYYLGARANNPVGDAQAFGALDIESKTGELLESLRLVAPEVKGLSVIVAHMPMIYADVGLRRKIPIQQLGEGVQRFLSILLCLRRAEGGAVMVDELGAGIHYSLLPKVCAALGTAARKYNSQLICTTHSYEFVETAKVGMAGADQADLSYVRLDRVAEEVTARTYDYSALAAAVDQSWEVR